MRAHSYKRFAIVIGVAAAGVMALGAQTALAGGEPVDSTPPDLRLSGNKKLELDNRVEVKASCGDGECLLNAQGWLAWASHPWGHGEPDVAARADLGPDETTTLNLKLEKKTRQRAGTALDNGKKVQATVVVRAKDAAGNKTFAKRTIRLVK